MNKHHVVVPGSQYGSWTVVRELGKPENSYPRRAMLCRCACGAEHNVGLYELAYSKSTKCLKCEYRTRTATRFKVGHRIGKLTVVDPSVGGSNCVLVVCECGRSKTLAPSAFLRSVSCGCSRYSRIKEAHGAWSGYEELSGTLWQSYIRAAKARGINFAISIKAAWDLFEAQGKNCALTGMPLKFGSYCREGKDGTTASLDRIDNNKHYTVENVRWVHKRLNRMKGALTEAEFQFWCSAVHNYTALLSGEDI